MRKVLVLAAVILLAGCTSKDPNSDDASAGTSTDLAGTAPFLAPPTPLRFASGDFEGNLTGEATFSITEQCFFDCANGGEEVFDLTPIVPADAPVELIVEVDGARADLEFVDAFAMGADEDGFTGSGSSFAVIVIRGASGSVFLHVYNPGGFGFPPEPNPTASFQAHSVVRADRLVASVPAAIKLQPGQTLNLTDEDVEVGILIAPDGTMERDVTAPFTLTANGTAGTYVVLMFGGDSTMVTGPDTTLTARRLAFVQDDPKPLTSGSATTWSFTPASRPLQIGLDITAAPTAAGFSVGSTMTQYEVTVTGPGNVEFISESQSCTPSCGFVLAGNGRTYDFASEFLDERLQSGAYDVSVSYTGNGMQAATWSVVIA
ncbi:MAG: hypothetical protein AABY18_04635 [Candidatus Thermoplasmatota archaeon]